MTKPFSVNVHAIIKREENPTLAEATAKLTDRLVVSNSVQSSANVHCGKTSTVITRKQIKMKLVFGEFMVMFGGIYECLKPINGDD